MPDYFIDPNRVADIIQQHGIEGLNDILQIARETIGSGCRVVIQYESTNAPPVVERVIITQDVLEAWRSEVTPIEFKMFKCPICEKSLKFMLEYPGQSNRFKCYDPPGCGSIFRLSTDNPRRLMKFDPNGGPETPYLANEL